MAWWGVLWKIEIHGFWDVRVWIASKCPQMNTMKVLVHKSFQFGGFCTWPSLAMCHSLARWLVGSFMKNWSSWFLRCGGWKGLQMSPYEYHKCIGAQKFRVQWTFQMAMVGGVARHSWMAWWGVLWKNDIRDFLDVKVWRASKSPQMNTIKVLVHESFELCGFCTWPSVAVCHGLARWLCGEFCEKLKFMVFEMWMLEWPPNVPKWIPWKSWCKSFQLC